MGACQSCLGLRRREDSEAEHARLIDDYLYPGGYGYGSINHSNQNQSDPEDVKREREALEAICQRASDTVIDIWALQPQPHLQPRATLSNSNSPGSSRVPSNEIQTPMLGDNTAAHENGASGSGTVRSVSSEAATVSRPSTGQKHLTPAPNNWGEVVISPRRKKNKAISTTNDGSGDIFDVLRVN